MSLGRRFLIGLASLVLRSQAVLIIALGTAAFCAWFVSSALNGNEETWTEQVTAWAWRTAVTFLPLGLAALVFAGPKLSANAPNPVLRIPGSMSLLVSLIGFAALSIIAASPLTIVWADVYEWLNAVGAWTELRTAWSSQFGGIVIAPFLLVVLVFFLELAPAVSMVAGSAALLILYLANAGHFPRVFLASVLVQGAFVIASFIMLDLSSHLTPLLTALIVEEVDLRPAVAWLERHDAAARVTTRHFDWLFFGYLAWVAVLFWSLKQVARHTGAVTPTNTTSPPLHLPARTAYAPRRLENRVRLGIRLAFLALGAAILVQLIQDVRAPRARYLSSSPGPGAMVDQVPNQIWVTFSDALDPTSSISVHLAAIESPSGELSFPNRQVSIRAGRDPGDRSGRSLRAELVPGLPAGLYRVAWKTVAQNERALVAGTFCFGVGISDRILRDLGGSLREREPGSLAEPDSKRAMLLITGLLFVGVAAALPWLLRRTDWRS